MIRPRSSSGGNIAVLVAAFLGWMFDGMEMAMFPLIARPALMQLQSFPVSDGDSYIGHWMGIITALFLIGAAIGGGVFGWLGDRVGRVKAIMLSIVCYSVFSGAIFFARTPIELGVLRFFAAFGMGGEWSLGVALVMEAWDQRHRSILAGLIGAANSVGFLILALVGGLFPVTPDNWRWFAGIGVLPILLVGWIYKYVPESKSWLLAEKSEDSPWRELSSPPLLRKTVIASLLAAVALIGTWGSVEWLPLWADQMTGRQFPEAKAHTQAVAAVAKIIGALLGALLAGRWGRKVSFFVFSISSFVGCAILFRGISNYGMTFLFMVFAVGIVTTTFYGWMPLHLPELFPTRVRATGQGVVMNAGRVLAALGALEMGTLMEAFGGSYARAGAVITCVYVGGFLLIWLLPENEPNSLVEETSSITAHANIVVK